MFKTMTSVLDKKKNPSQEQIKKISSFIFVRWLAGSPLTILAANIINRYDKIPIENQYQMIKGVFAGKIGYIPYPKKQQLQIQKKIKYLSEHYKISHEKACDYLKYISDEQLKEIVDMYSEYEMKK